MKFRRNLILSILFCFLIIMNAMVYADDYSNDINVNSDGQNSDDCEEKPCEDDEYEHRINVRLCSIATNSTINELTQKYQSMTKEQRIAIIKELEGKKQELLELYNTSSKTDRVGIMEQITALRNQYMALYNSMTDDEKKDLKNDILNNRDFNRRKIGSSLNNLTEEQINQLKSETTALVKEYEDKFKNAKTDEEKEQLMKEFKEKLSELREKYGLSIEPQQNNYKIQQRFKKESIN